MQMIWLSIAILFLATTAPEQDPPPSAEAPATVACARCEGEGSFLQECRFCGGEGDHSCPGCKFKPRLRRRWTGGWVCEAELEAIMAQNDELLEQLGNIDFGFYPKNSPKKVKLKPGEIKCPANCRSGKLLHIKNWVDCLPCKGGKFRCRFCKKGRVDCRRCDGTRKIVEACDDCAGVGRLPDVSTRPVELCPWCRGTGKRHCGSCDKTGSIWTTCPECVGWNQSTCEGCKGFGRLPCKKCGGRGAYGSKRAACFECEEQGFFECDQCDEGSWNCDTCSGTGVATMKCPHCEGSKEHPCNGCEADDYELWEQTADLETGRGDFGRARAWLEEARRRCERRYEAALERAAEYKLGDSIRKKCRLAIERELRNELRRLDRQLKKAKSAERKAKKD